jgi:hypothetical protein
VSQLTGVYRLSLLIDRWQKVIKEQKEEQERRERGREVMSRCLNAAGRKDIFKGFNHWKRVSFPALNEMMLRYLGYLT